MITAVPHIYNDNQQCHTAAALFDAVSQDSEQLNRVPSVIQRKAIDSPGLSPTKHGSQGLIARNTVWMLGTSSAPFVFAVLAIPVLLGSLGASRFGVLAIAWALLGYFSLLDLGIGRALTQAMASAVGDDSKAPDALFWTALASTVCLGILIAVLLAVGAPYLVAVTAKMPVAFQDEATTALRLIALAVPFAVSGTVVRGVLEAHQDFRAVSALATVGNFLNFAAPVIAAEISPRLEPVAWALVAGRIFAWLPFFLAALAKVTKPDGSAVFNRSHVSALVGFGGWVTISNVVSPMMVYADRFLIASILTPAVLAHYVVPSEVTIRVAVIATAFGGVLFPAFSQFAQGTARLRQLFGRGVKFAYIVTVPLMLSLVTMGPVALRVWLGPTVEHDSGVVLQILALGLLSNGIAQVPFSLLQGIGRPDLPAKFHVVELPLYLVAVYLLTREAGIQGAAMAYVMRVTLDGVLLFWAASKMVEVPWREYVPQVSWAVATLILVGLAFQPEGQAERGATFIGLNALFLIAAWRRLLDQGEQALVKSILVSRWTR